MSIANDLHFTLSIIKTEWKNTFSSFIIKNSHHISRVSTKLLSKLTTLSLVSTQVTFHAQAHPASWKEVQM